MVVCETDTLNYVINMGNQGCDTETDLKLLPKLIRVSDGKDEYTSRSGIK